MESPKIISVNPGDGECFPWLSNIAPNFEFYIINSLKFMYKSSVSSFTQGAIAMTPEFDPHNHKLGAPASLTEMLNKEGAAKGNVWSDCQLTIQTSRLREKKLVRSEHHTTRTSEHLRQTELGQVYIALYNIGEADVTGAYGDLYIEYDVTLKSPNYMNKSIKTHYFEGRYVDEGLGGRYPPILGGTDDNTPTGNKLLTDEYQYLGHDESTLGVSLSNQTVGTGLGGSVEASRVRFEEPFHGQMTYHCTNHLGSMNSASDPVLTTEIPGMVYTPGYEPEIKARAIPRHGSKSGGTGADWTYVWDVIASAGAVLDLSFNGLGTLIAGESNLTLTDVAAGLLEVALL
jgi:hypothetical protein